MVGRQLELAQLLAALDETELGRGQTVFLAGEPGIGKSRLAAELADRARSKARVLGGTCWEAAGSPAYWPWVQCLRSYVRDPDVDGVPPLDAEDAALVAELVPELRQQLPHLPAAPSMEAGVARFRLFDAVASFLLEAGRARPLLLVLDDLHAADAPSLVLLTHLSRAIQGGRVMLLGCYRDTEIVRGQPFAAALGDIARQGGTTTVPLSGLSEEEVAGFLEATMGAVPDGSLVALVQEQAAGNPLFVGEVARTLLGHQRSGARALIPRGIGQVIDRRLGLISPRCRQLLAAASVFGRDFGILPLAKLSGSERAQLLALLDEATEARLVEEVPGAVGRWRFAHGLVRDALYAHLGPSERVDLHDRIGAVLEGLYADDPDLPGRDRVPLRPSGGRRGSRPRG
jgi:predicted ATPase